MPPMTPGYLGRSGGWGIGWLGADAKTLRAADRYRPGRLPLRLHPVPRAKIEDDGNEPGVIGKMAAVSCYFFEVLFWNNVVENSRGYVGHGDATSYNVQKPTKNHWSRSSHTLSGSVPMATGISLVACQVHRPHKICRSGWEGAPW